MFEIIRSRRLVRYVAKYSTVFPFGVCKNTIQETSSHWW